MTAPGNCNCHKTPNHIGHKKWDFCPKVCFNIRETFLNLPFFDPFAKMHFWVMNKPSAENWVSKSPARVQSPMCLHSCLNCKREFARRWSFERIYATVDLPSHSWCGECDQAFALGESCSAHHHHQHWLISTGKNTRSCQTASRHLGEDAFSTKWAQLSWLFNSQKPENTQASRIAFCSAFPISRILESLIGKGRLSSASFTTKKEKMGTQPHKGWWFLPGKRGKKNDFKGWFFIFVTNCD